MAPEGFSKGRCRSCQPVDVPDGQRSGALRGRKSRRIARGRGLRNDSRHRLRATSRGTVAFYRAFWFEKDCRRNESPRAKRRKIRTVRHFEKARARWNKVLRVMKSSLEAPEKQVAEETSAKTQKQAPASVI